MREIKFRAWDTGLNFMMPVENINFNNEFINVNGIWRMFFEIILMQYTGLKDKNGTEIYEGDIIKVTHHPFNKFSNGIGLFDGNHEVKWDDHDLTWLAGNLLLARIKPYIKVIGNIYENPELLGVEK